MLLLLSSCSHLQPALPLPDVCVVEIAQDPACQLTCGSGVVTHTADYLCFQKDDIEPFLERGSK